MGIIFLIINLRFIEFLRAIHFNFHEIWKLVINSNFLSFPWAPNVLTLVNLKLSYRSTMLGYFFCFYCCDCCVFKCNSPFLSFIFFFFSSLFISNFFALFKFYVKGRGRDGEEEISSTCWFTPQMGCAEARTLELLPSHSQGCRDPNTWETSYATFSCTLLAGCWIGS